MVQLNKATNMPELTRIMQEFVKHSEQMEMKQELIGETLDNALDDEEDEKETDLVVNQVWQPATRVCCVLLLPRSALCIPLTLNASLALCVPAGVG